MSPASPAPPTEELGGAEPPNLGRVDDGLIASLTPGPAGLVASFPAGPLLLATLTTVDRCLMRFFGVSPGGRLWLLSRSDFQPMA